MSLNASTEGVRSNVIGARLTGDVAVVPLPSDGLQLHARSKRNAPCSVSRPRVQVSCTNADEVAVRSAFCQIDGRRGRGAVALRRAPAPRPVEAQRALQREPAARP